MLIGVLIQGRSRGKANAVDKAHVPGAALAGKCDLQVKGSPMVRFTAAFFFVLLVASCAGRSGSTDVSRGALPAMAWDHRPEAEEWTRSTLAAIQSHGAVLLQTVPGDIAEYCPAYPRADDANRAAFWSGILSALAKHESTWRPEASGGGGLWIGLTQIDPRTARFFGCQATSVSALKDGAANLSCAVRIAAKQVGRDAMLVRNDQGWRGLGRDWAPFRSADKRADMAAWTSRQEYCSVSSGLSELRPSNIASELVRRLR